jgi:hypothetical protein
LTLSSRLAPLGGLMLAAIGHAGSSRHQGSHPIHSFVTAQFR